MTAPTLRLDGTPCECGRPTGQCVKGDLDRCPTEDDDEFDDGDDWLEQECHLGDDGQCGLAGTEHCDFECPYRDSDLFAGSEAWRKKHGEKSQ